MSQPYATGPVQIYVGIGATITHSVITNPDHPKYIGGGQSQIIETVNAGKQPVFLGTCKRWPVILLKPEYKPIFTDFAGSVPDDMMWMGEQAIIIAELNRYNENVYRSIASRPFYWAERGKAYSSGVGTLMLREGQSYPLWLVFPYAAKLAFGPADGQLATARFVPTNVAGTRPTVAAMPAGYRFLETVLEGPDRLDPLGSMARSIHLVFRAITQHKKQGTQERRLYDHDMSAINVLPT